jgi:very-short-patch-repair endonuclease
MARALRREPTWAERTLWRHLRNHRFCAYKFRRQHPNGPYVLDFYCVSAKLAIELDGDPHGYPNQKNHDESKDRYLAQQGIRVLRFWNDDLRENKDGVLVTILQELEQRTEENPHPDPWSPLAASGAAKGGQALAPRCCGGNPLPSTARERGNNLKEIANYVH